MGYIFHTLVIFTHVHVCTHVRVWICWIKIRLYSKYITTKAVFWFENIGCCFIVPYIVYTDCPWWCVRKLQYKWYKCTVGVPNGRCVIGSSGTIYRVGGEAIRRFLCDVRYCFRAVGFLLTSGILAKCPPRLTLYRMCLIYLDTACFKFQVDNADSIH